MTRFVLHATLCLTLMGALLGGCCEEDKPTPPTEAADTKAPADNKDDAPPAAAPEGDEGAQAEEAAVTEEKPDEGHVEVEIDPVTGESKVVGGEKAPGENEEQSPTDVLYDLERNDLAPKLEAFGWKMDNAEGQKLKNGFEYEITSEDGERKMKIEMREFADNDAADKYMFKIEKTPEVALGRVDGKTLAVFPGDNATERDPNRVLKILMNPEGKELKFPEDPSDNPPPEDEIPSDAEGGQAEPPAEGEGDQGEGDPAEAPAEGAEAPAEGAEAPAEGAEAPAEGAEAPAEGAEGEPDKEAPAEGDSQ